MSLTQQFPKSGPKRSKKKQTQTNYIQGNRIALAQMLICDQPDDQSLQSSMLTSTCNMGGSQRDQRDISTLRDIRQKQSILSMRAGADKAEALDSDVPSFQTPLSIQDRAKSIIEERNPNLA